MILEKMTSFVSSTQYKYGIGQFCIHFMHIITLWLCAKVGIDVLPDGCRAIPKGHLNFDPRMVEVFGGKDARDSVNKAITFQYIMGWIEHNRKHGRNLREGQAYSYNSYSKWAAKIKIFHPKTIARHIDSFEAMGLLASQQFRQHEGDPTKFYTSPLRLSDDIHQLSLGLVHETPRGVTGDSTHSSMHNRIDTQTPMNKRQQQQQPRVGGYASAHTDAGGVAQFPKRDLDPKEGGEPKAVQPEARDLKESQDGGQHEASPPVAPAPSPTIPEWMPSFFTGCAESELLQLLHTFTEPVLLSARNYAESARNNIDNPPGYVRAQLKKGWRPPTGKGDQTELEKAVAAADLGKIHLWPVEELQWIVSDDCIYSDMHKRAARAELEARVSGYGQAEVR